MQRKLPTNRALSFAIGHMRRGWNGRAVFAIHCAGKFRSLMRLASEARLAKHRMTQAAHDRNPTWPGWGPGVVEGCVAAYLQKNLVEYTDDMPSNRNQAVVDAMAVEAFPPIAITVKEG